MSKLKRGKIGVYGKKTRSLQRRLSAEAFGLTFKDANVYKYLGSRDSVSPDINDIQNKVLFEVPDRAYDPTPVNIMIGMEPMGETAMDFSRFGIINPIGNEQTFRVHVNEFEGCLGRPLIVGDVFEIPFFEKECKKAFWEITDVDDKPSYEKFYYVIKATVLDDARTTREIPIERTNSDFMDSLMSDMDMEMAQQVPTTDLVDPDQPQPAPQEVDYRNKKQASFLDDPSKIFNED